MSKGPSPLLGFNTNVRHKGRTFHIQTEDSGVQHPHVITHLFADGGRIIKTNKTSYAHLLELADWREQVKKIMQDQHKAMFIALRDGQFDVLIDPSSAAAASTAAAALAADAAPPTNPDPVPTVASQPRPPSPSVAAMPAMRVPTAAGPAAPAAPTGPVAPRAPGTPSSASLHATPAVRPAAGTPATPVRPTGADPAAAAGSTNPPSARSGRYAPVRSPEVLSSFRGKSEASLFGDGMMSEKSLDEVILAYLADDLEDKGNG